MSMCGSCYGDANGQDVRTCPSHKCKKKICNSCDPMVNEPLTVKSLASNILGVLGAIEAIGLGGEALIFSDFIDIDEDEEHRVICNGCLVKRTHKYFKEKNSDRWPLSISMAFVASGFTWALLESMSIFQSNPLIVGMVLWILWSFCLHRISLRLYFPNNDSNWTKFKKSLIPLVVHRYGYNRISSFIEQKPPHKGQKKLLHGDALGEDDSQSDLFDDAQKEWMDDYILENFMSFQL